MISMLFLVRRWFDARRLRRAASRDLTTPTRADEEMLVEEATRGIELLEEMLLIEALYRRLFDDDELSAS